MKKNESNEYFIFAGGNDGKAHKYMLYLDDQKKEQLNSFLGKLDKAVPIKKCLLDTLSYFYPIEESEYYDRFHEDYVKGDICHLKINNNSLVLDFFDSPHDKDFLGNFVVKIKDSENISVESCFSGKFFLKGCYKKGEIPATILAYPEELCYFDEKGDNYLIKNRDQDIYPIDNRNNTFSVNYKYLSCPNYFGLEENDNSLIKKDNDSVEFTFSSTDDNFLNRMNSNLVSNYFKAVLAGEISNLDASKALKNELCRQRKLDQITNKIKDLKEAKNNFYNYEKLVGSDKYNYLNNINNSLNNLRHESGALKQMKNDIFNLSIKEEKRKRKYYHN